MLRRLTVLCLAACVWSAVASAGTLGKGASEIQGSAGLTSESASASGGGGSITLTTVSVDALWGYCVTSNWEFGPELLVSSTSGSGSTLSNFGVTGNAIYNFSTSGSNLVPFLNAGLGFSSTSGGGSSVTGTILPVIGGGLRVLLGNSASINVSAAYERESFKISGFTVTDNDIVVKAGFSVFPSGFGTGGGSGAMKK